MARKRKPSGSLNRGPFTTNDVERALRAAGGEPRQGGGHQTVYEGNGWKVPVSQSWTSLRAGCPILNGIARTIGVSKKELLRLLQPEGLR